jgi:hypothetical protein
MSNNNLFFSRDCFSLAQLKSRSAIANRLSIKSLYFAAMSDDVRAFTTVVGLFLLLIYFPLDVIFLFVSGRCSHCWDANSCSLSVFSLFGSVISTTSRGISALQLSWNSMVVSLVTFCKTSLIS